MITVAEERMSIGVDIATLRRCSRKIEGRFAVDAVAQRIAPLLIGERGTIELRTVLILEITLQGVDNILADSRGAVDTVFGILPEDEESDDSLESVMSIIMDVRTELRKRKADDLADMIRNRLAEAGIQLEDSADGMKWKRI